MCEAIVECVFAEYKTLTPIFPGSHDIVHVKDATGHAFATRLSNVFVIGRGTKAMVSLPRGKGIRLSIAEERDRRLAEKAKMS